jgi:tetratricopeptide (TPR) repeat protein
MSRRISTILSTTGAFLVLSLAAAFAGEVDWAQPPYEEILQRAAQENRPVFIDFYATWCGPCKRLDQITYQDEKVIGYLNSIVAVKYDAEKDEGETLAKKFKVKAYPTLVLVSSNGDEIDRYVGYLDAEKFLDVIEGYHKGVGTVGFYEAQLEKNPDDIETLYTLGLKHADAVRPERAKATLERILVLDPESEHKADIWSSLGYVMYADDRYDEAVAYYNKLLEEFPDTKHHDESLQILARVYYRMEEKDKAIEAYTAYVDRHPDDPKAMNGFAWFCAKRKFGFEQALPVALKAVELSDRDPGILDTLAELYFAMGDFDNAIKIGEEALSKEPEDEYLEEQLNKYRDAAKTAPEESDD